MVRLGTFSQGIAPPVSFPTLPFHPVDLICRSGLSLKPRRKSQTEPPPQSLRLQASMKCVIKDSSAQSSLRGKARAVRRRELPLFRIPREAATDRTR